MNKTTNFKTIAYPFGIDQQINIMPLKNKLATWIYLAENIIVWSIPREKFSFFFAAAAAPRILTVLQFI